MQRRSSREDRVVWYRFRTVSQGQCKQGRGLIYLDPLVNGASLSARGSNGLVDSGAKVDATRFFDREDFRGGGLGSLTSMGSNCLFV